MTRYWSIFIVYVLTVSFLGLSAQDHLDSSLKKHRAQGFQFLNLRLYAEAMNEFEQAIEVAQQINNDSLVIDLTISLAELMRISRDFNQGLDLLAKLENTEKYPHLHIRKLGREVALIHEKTYPPDYHKLDTIRKKLGHAVSLAEQYNFQIELAGLKNELGYFISRNESYRKGLPVLFEAAELFLHLKDTQNYVSAMTHVFDDYMELKEYKKTDSLRNYLYPLVKDKDWYQLQTNLYYMFSKDLRRQNDSMGYFFWLSKCRKAEVLYESSVSNQHMAQYRVLHKTKKYQEQAAESAQLAKEKEVELQLEEQRNLELTLYLSLLVLVIAAVVFLLVRERRLKTQLNQTNLKLNETNQKYLDLVVESNHRIKNNLQMVISMLKYTSKDVNAQDSVALKKISGKIRTVSALHKHLYLEVHNEKVSIKKYFEEIISLNKEIASSPFHVDLKVPSLEIESEALVYFGLILNEMLSNTFEHSLSEIKNIFIQITDYSNGYLFEYGDESSHDETSKEGNGIQLIRNLVKRVGGSGFHLATDVGKYQFIFHV
tara:strand:- start:28 stop:1659 length:1632 start_codon:yes stop_codon:yes gene_type:complete